MAPAAAAVAAAGAEAAAVEEDDSAPPPHKGRGWRRWAALSSQIILQKQNDSAVLELNRLTVKLLVVMATALLLRQL